MRTSRVLLGAAAVLTSCTPSRPHTPETPHFTLEEAARFGSQLEGGAALSQVAAVLATPSEVFVLESSPPRVAVFNPQGDWLRDFGAEGEGPGEFRRPSALGLRGDSVWVGDAAGGRVEVFTPTGAHARSVRWTIPPDSLGTRSVPIGLMDDGAIVAGPPGLSVGAAATGAVTHRHYHRATQDGTPVNLIHSQRVAPDDFFISATLPGGSTVMGGHPMQRAPLVKLLPDGSGLVAVDRDSPSGPDGASYRLRSLRPDGSTRFDVAIPYEPLTAEGWLERHLESIEADMIAMQGSADRAFTSAIGEALAERAFHPPVTDVVPGIDGAVWVRREDTGSETVAWEIIDPQGALMGQLLLPSEMRILAASSTEVWAVELDEFDVPFVLRMRVVG